MEHIGVVRYSGIQDGTSRRWSFLDTLITGDIVLNAGGRMENLTLDSSQGASQDHVSRRSFIEHMGFSTLVAAFLGKEALSEEQKQFLLTDESIIHEDQQDVRLEDPEHDAEHPTPNEQ